VLASAAGAAALLYPLADHYLAAAREVGGHDWGTVADRLPTPWAWLLMDPANWLYGWRWLGWLHTRPGVPVVPQLGLGLFTTAVAVWGLWRARGTPAVRFLALTAAGLAAATAGLPGRLSLWYAAFVWLPGAAAVRAVYRVSLWVLFATAAGAAAFVRRRKAWAALAVAAACVLEQGRALPTFSKDEALRRAAAVAARVPPGGAAFLYSPRGDPHSGREGIYVNVDALWAGLEADAPTLNGYSGNAPPDWPFALPQVRTPQDRRAVDDGLADWCARTGLDPASVARVYDPPEREGPD
jgi:hypothetical protein